MNDCSGDDGEENREQGDGKSENKNQNAELAASNPQRTVILNWEPMIMEIIDEVKNGKRKGMIAAKFHNTISESIIKIVHLTDIEKVVLTGGCFQNKYLTEKTINRLLEEDLKPYWHQRISPNDGGIAVGQIMAAERVIKSRSFDP